METGAEWSLTDAAFIDEFDEQEGLCRVTYDPVHASTSLAVITAVANITGRDPSELEPLQESIDAEAVDALFAADGSSVSQLTFQYSGCEITVEPNDVVEVVAG